MRCFGGCALLVPCAAGLGCLTLLAKVEDNLLNDISKERNVEGLERCVPAEGCFFEK